MDRGSKYGIYDCVVVTGYTGYIKFWNVWFFLFALPSSVKVPRTDTSTGALDAMGDYLFFTTDNPPVSIRHCRPRNHHNIVTSQSHSIRLMPNLARNSPTQGNFREKERDTELLHALLAVQWCFGVAHPNPWPFLKKKKLYFVVWPAEGP